MKELRGRTALVTGGASGIGRSLALALAGEGCDIVLVDLDVCGLEVVAGEVSRLGAGVSTHQVDVGEPRQVEALAGEVHPGILVNCAGMGIMADLEDTEPDEWRRIMDVNLFGPINMVRAFLPALKSNGGGHIVNIASGFGLIAFPTLGAYSTSKFALVGYSEALAVELAKYGVTVTTVCPGVTSTPILEYSEKKGFDGARVDRGLGFLMPLISTTPERLAGSVIRAVKKDRALLVHTWLCKLLFWTKRLSPGLCRSCMSGTYRAIRRMTEWKGVSVE